MYKRLYKNILCGRPNIRLTKLFGGLNYSVLNRIPNNDIWLQTKYQLFATIIRFKD